MFKEWDKFRGWTVLGYFLSRPDSRMHIRGVAKALGVSPRTAEHYCKYYASEGVLEAEKVANSTQFGLVNGDFLVQSLKAASSLSLLRQSGFPRKFAKSNSAVSLALYGSHASGRYSEKSDVDLLCISGRKELDQTLLREVEALFSAQVGLTVYSLGEWRKLKLSSDSFYNSVKASHVLLWGAEL